MTNKNTAANTETTASNNGGSRPSWPQRFGTMTSLQVKQGRSGKYGIAVIDCNKFEQTAFVFNKMALDKLIAAGEGAKVWVKGPIEAATRKNADGKTYQEDVFKVVYAKDITPEEEKDEAPAAEDDEAPIIDDADASVDADSAAGEVNSDIDDDEIPF